MCVGLPARVLRVAGPDALVDPGDGRVRKVALAAPESIRRGDYVLLYANVVVNKIDRVSALESVQTQKEMAIQVERDEGRSPDDVARYYDSKLRELSRTTPRRPN